MIYLPRPEKSLKIPTQYKGVLVFATIHEELFPLPHYCRIGDFKCCFLGPNRMDGL